MQAKNRKKSAMELPRGWVMKKEGWKNSWILAEFTIISFSTEQFQCIFLKKNLDPGPWSHPGRMGKVVFKMRCRSIEISITVLHSTNNKLITEIQKQDITKYKQQRSSKWAVNGWYTSGRQQVATIPGQAMVICLNSFLLQIGSLSGRCRVQIAFMSDMQAPSSAAVQAL